MAGEVGAKLPLIQELLCGFWHRERSLPAGWASYMPPCSHNVGRLGGRMRAYWTAAVTKRAQEQCAAYHVAQQGFTVYMPKAMVLTPKGKERCELLFPGYMFIKLHQCWKVLLSTRGVRRVFMCDEVPTRVPDDEICALQAREDVRGMVALKDVFAPGMKVEIKNKGALSGMLGEISRTSNHRDRVLVLLRMLGREVEVELNRSLVRVVVT
jgi:transcription antitermination factor NusG